MKQRDIALLMDAVAPAIVDLFGKALAPVLERLAATEKKLAAAEAALAEWPDVEGIVARAIGELPQVPTAEEIVALMPKAPTAEEVAGLIPRPEDGKSVSIDEVRALVGEAVAALPAMPTAEEIAALVVVPEIDAEGLKSAVNEEVGRQVAALPAPVEVDVAALARSVATSLEDPIKQAAAEAVAQIPAPRGVDPEEIKAEIARQVCALPKPPTAEEVAALIPAPENGKSVTVADVSPLVEETVAKAVAALPAAKDGVGLVGALIDREGNLVVTLTDGSTKNLGGVLGRDGFSLEDFEVVDGEETFMLRFTRGDVVKEFPLPKPTLADFYRGVWKEGPHKAGSVVTWGGSIWLAKRETEDRPETSDAWTLIVKKGRDGKDGEAPRGPAKVKL